MTLSTEITFQPYAPLTQCATITIIRDFLVEPEELFYFFLNNNQDDEALALGSSTLSMIVIDDEEGGIRAL